ncbi:MAG: C39 family peptidase [Terrisporobacter sp.]|uniref:C39 family peptidase n=1 Tax=Terrisporobacter sp. TaxID=1965305 RepID=UPI002FC7A6FA
MCTYIFSYGCCRWSLISEGSTHFGLKSSGVPKNKNMIIETLKSNKPIIASMGPGEFTTKGHFIVLKGIDSNNST